MTYNYLWRAWYSMIKRCTDESAHNYELYGGRGIKVCDEWMKSYESFASDVGERPSKKHSLDRIDNNGSYTKGNVRWATPKEQANNRRTSVRFYDKTTMQLSDETGLSMAAIYKRRSSGMDDGRISSPVDLRKRPIRHGVIAGYARGCRCQACRDANAMKRRCYVEKQKSKGGIQ